MVMPGPAPCSMPQNGSADRVATSTGVVASAHGGSQAAGGGEAEADAEADGAGATDDADGDGDGAGAHAATRHRNAAAMSGPHPLPGRREAPAGSPRLSP